MRKKYNARVAQAGVGGFVAILGAFPMITAAQSAMAIGKDNPIFLMKAFGLWSIPITEPMFRAILYVVMIALLVLAVIAIVLLVIALLRRFHSVPRDAAFAFGWNAMRKNLLFFIGMSALYLVFQNLINGITATIGNTNPWLITSIQNMLKVPPPLGNYFDGYTTIKMILGLLFSSFATAGATSMALAYGMQNKKSFRAFFISPALVGRFLVGNILYTVGLFSGSILFLIPAAWFGSKFFFWPYILLDKRVSFVQAFRESARMTKGAKFELFLFWFLSMAILFLGMMVFGIGYLIALPVVSLANVFVYKNMSMRAPE